MATLIVDGCVELTQELTSLVPHFEKTIFQTLSCNMSGDFKMSLMLLLAE